MEAGEVRLLVISHTPHYLQAGVVAGWGPTVRELDNLARLFDELVHLAPLYPGPAPASSLGYQSERVQFRAVQPSGGEKLVDKLAIAARYPAYTRAILREFKSADLVHVRCPANLSLLAILLLALVRRPGYRWVKYAGNWQPAGREPWSYRLQRWWLQKGFHHGIVTVNGNWTNQPQHVITFPNPCISGDELAVGRSEAMKKNMTYPVRLLFVGRLEEAKGALRVVEIAYRLALGGVDFRLKMIGDGPERQACEQMLEGYSLSGRVELLGWLPKNELANYYSQAHFLLLPSVASEGWPKVLSEGMAYGAAPLAGAVSSIPQVLQESQAGLAIQADHIQGYVQAIQDFLAHPEEWKRTSQRGVAYAARFSYDNYLKKVQETFEIAWGLKIPELPLAAPGHSDDRLPVDG